MFPDIKNSRYNIQPDLQSAVDPHRWADQLTLLAEHEAKKQNLPIFCLSRIKRELLTGFNLPPTPNAFYLQNLDVPSGLWINLSVGIPGGREQLEKTGRFDYEMYPVIHPSVYHYNKDENVYLVLSMPKEIIMDGQRVLKSDQVNYNRFWLEDNKGIFIQGPKAAIIAAEVWSRLSLQLPSLLRVGLDVTNPDVRAEAAEIRHQTLSEFESMLAGKLIMVPSFITYRTNGREFWVEG